MSKDAPPTQEGSLNSFEKVKEAAETDVAEGVDPGRVGSGEAGAEIGDTSGGGGGGGGVGVSGGGSRPWGRSTFRQR